MFDAVIVPQKWHPKRGKKCPFAPQKCCFLTLILMKKDPQSGLFWLKSC